MKLSKFTLTLGAYIVVSAYFMQEVWTAWKAIIGINTLTLIFIFLCLWIFFAALLKNTKEGINIKRITLACAVYASGFIFAWKQPYMSEKAHVLEYGVLAWLSIRDISKSNRPLIKCVLYAFIFSLIIGSLDEGFQKLLPWRVFEARDIATNLISSALGIALFCIMVK